MDPSSSDRKRFPFLRLFGTLLAAGLLILLLSRQGWDEILSSFTGMPAWRFAAALLLTFISRFAVSGRWYVLLKSADAHISPAQALRITFAGLFASNFLPTTIGGDVARLAAAIRLGCDRSTALASLIVDRLVGMTGMALAVPLSFPAIFAKGSPLPPGFLGFHGLPLMLTAAPGGFVGKVIARLRAGTRKVVEAVMIWWKQPRSLAASLGFTFVHMACHFGSISVLLSGMSEPVPFWKIAGVWSLTYFITLLPVSVNGLGVQELATTVLFTWLGSISTGSAGALSVLIRVFQMAASLPGALFIPEMIEGGRRGNSGAAGER